MIENITVSFIESELKIINSKTLEISFKDDNSSYFKMKQCLKYNTIIYPSFKLKTTTNIYHTTGIVSYVNNGVVKILVDTPLIVS